MSRLVPTHIVFLSRRWARSLTTALVAIIATGNLLRAQDPGAAEEETAPVSLSRLSIRISPTYFAVPWKDLNESFGAVRDAFAYSSQYPNPSGYIERHLGDLAQSGVVSYRITDGFHLIVQGLSTSAKSGFEIKSQSNTSPYSAEYRNNFDLRVEGWTIGAAAETESPIPLRFSVSFGRGFAELNYQYKISNILTTVVQEYDYSAVLKSGSGLLLLELESSLHVIGPVSFSLGAAYRNLRFPSLRGEGTIKYRDPNYERSESSTTTMVRDGSYYGVQPSNNLLASFDVQYILRMPWFAVNGRYYPTSPSTVPLDLSGFGVKGGIVIEF